MAGLTTLLRGELTLLQDEVAHWWGSLDNDEMRGDLLFADLHMLDSTVSQAIDACTAVSSSRSPSVTAMFASL
jgi:hypothetical protein